jgi:hypothetical protein
MPNLIQNPSDNAQTQLHHINISPAANKNNETNMNLASKERN